MLCRACQQHIPDMTNGAGRVQVLRANVDAVLDAMTTKHAERIIQAGQPFLGCSIAAISQEPVCLQQSGWPDEAIRVPPEGGAGSRATGTQDALIETV